MKLSAFTPEAELFKKCKQNFILKVKIGNEPKKTIAPSSLHKALNVKNSKSPNIIGQNKREANKRIREALNSKRSVYTVNLRRGVKIEFHSI